MTSKTLQAATEQARTIEAVQRRLVISAAAMLGIAEGFNHMPPELIRHLAVELRAIALCLDALVPDDGHHGV